MNTTSRGRDSVSSYRFRTDDEIEQSSNEVIVSYEIVYPVTDCWIALPPVLALRTERLPQPAPASTA